MSRPKRFDWETTAGRNVTASMTSNPFALAEVTQVAGDIASWYCVTKYAKESGEEDTIEEAQKAVQAWFDELWASESEVSDE